MSTIIIKRIALTLDGQEFEYDIRHDIRAWMPSSNIFCRICGRIYATVRVSTSPDSWTMFPGVCKEHGELSIFTIPGAFSYLYHERDPLFDVNAFRMPCNLPKEVLEHDFLLLARHLSLPPFTQGQNE